MAKKAKTEAPPLYLVRKGEGLYGEMQLDRDRIAEFEQGKRLVSDMRVAGRNIDRLRFYWAFLREVVAGTGCARDAADLHQAVKLKTGYTNDVMLDGFIIKVAASIAFDQMEEDTFIRFLESALEFIAATYGVIPKQTNAARNSGVTPDQLMNRGEKAA